MKEMNWLKALIYPALFMVMTGCNNAIHETSISGKTTDEWNGQTISLYTYQNGNKKILANSIIEKGKFSIKLPYDSSYVATLSIDMGMIPYLQPVALEAGKIKVLIGEESYVGGTPLNDLLQTFMIDKALFIANDTIGGEESSKRFATFIQQQIEKYKEAPAVADFIKRAYGESISATNTDKK